MNLHEEHATKDIASKIQALNDQMLQAEEAGKIEGIAPLLHEDFFIVRASGVSEDRATYLDAVPKNADRGRKADQVNVRLYDDCAVYTCCVTTTVDKSGNPAVGHFWNTRVFIQQAGAWRCVAWQVTEIRNP